MEWNGNKNGDSNHGKIVSHNIHKILKDSIKCKCYQSFDILGNILETNWKCCRTLEGFDRRSVPSLRITSHSTWSVPHHGSGVTFTHDLDE